ncbi:uncharacterized protein ACWYII_023660 [Salvelinus alpinus]|uniref:uncharacterized protein n=1 Tax=Salvelinus alpinus TaxID=8036 RepID=UPI0039FDD382
MWWKGPYLPEVSARPIQKTPCGHYMPQWQERGEKERADENTVGQPSEKRAQERVAMDETIDAIAYAEPPPHWNHSCQLHHHRPCNTCSSRQSPQLQVEATCMLSRPHGRRFLNPTNTSFSKPSASGFVHHHNANQPPLSVKPRNGLLWTNCLLHLPWSPIPQQPHLVSLTTAIRIHAPLQHRKGREKLYWPPVTPPIAPPSVFQVKEDTTCCACCGEYDPPASSPQECESEVPWVPQHWFHCRCVHWDPEVELDFYRDFCDNIEVEM